MKFRPEVIKKFFQKSSLSSLLSLVAFMAVFVVVSYYSSQYSEEIRSLVQKENFLGIGVYIFITVVAVVVAPVTTVPLIPVAAQIWGPFWAAMLSIVAWVIGSVIAFVLAQKYGRHLVERLISLEKIERIEKFCQKNIFFGQWFFYV